MSIPPIVLESGVVEWRTPLATEMRLFCSCERWVFNRILEKCTREELKKQGQGTFGLNSRYCDDAILKAKAVIESKDRLLTLEIEETKTKLTRAKRKLSWAEKDIDKAVKANDPARIERAKRTCSGRKARVKKLADKMVELQVHRSSGNIPKVVFGGRFLWKRVCKGRASNEEWRQARWNRLYARGDETKGGNPNLKISWRNENLLYPRSSLTCPSRKAQTAKAGLK